MTSKPPIILTTLILALTLAIHPALAALDVSPQPQPVDLDTIDAFVEAQMARHRIPGLALVITQGDHIIHQRGFGCAGEGRPVTPQTPFYIGSISKAFTALAVMQLVEQGQVDLDAPVQTYVPWFQVADAQSSERITVRHLLHQTSGLAEATYMPDLPPGTTLEAAARDMRYAEPVDPPGTAFHYFNQNYVALGMIVETVSGQPYGDYVHEHIFAPLAMDDSAATLVGIAQLNIAQGYGVLFGFPIARQESISAYDMPKGGIVSTTEDMAHFLIAQNNGGVYESARLLSAEGVAQMHRPDTPGAPPGVGYAMGWIAEPRDGVPVLQHGGSLDNFRSFAWLLPEQGYGFAVLINQNGFVPAMLAYSDIPEGIAVLLTGKAPHTGLSMRAFYWGITALIAAVVGLDLHWWLVRFPAYWTGAETLSATKLKINLAAGFLRTTLFYAAPYILLRSLGRGFTWELGITMAMTETLFVVWNIAMGLTKTLARLLALPSIHRQGLS